MGHIRARFCYGISVSRVIHCSGSGTWNVPFTQQPDLSQRGGQRPTYDEDFNETLLCAARLSEAIFAVLVKRGVLNEMGKLLMRAVPCGIV